MHRVFNSPLMRMDRSEGSLVITPTSDSLEQNLIPEPPGPDIRDSPTLLQTHSPVGAVAPSPSRSRRTSDSGFESAAKTVVLFPGSGSIAAATLGALGSVAAVATGSVALLGAGAAVCAFKFSPGLNKERSAASREERARYLEEANRVSEEKRRMAKENEIKRREGEEETLAAVLSARGNFR
ncbi:uncharacterized protein LOC111704410 isoform X2 [Eurytemora carolleeae]|uniref:uncharacterized protein LOC111704410 isoform X2 n=1 Tax=Eurytemora carolleeae TaxID=1294199 RepID=UPI000C77E280|nr:uncharacterized protein LOC111704410 isoform X2 [Eurytemora carolleeae]|eukprot:XP_023332411.1 uncharacterized protein LOC111704410 isoform X2 [Eurytemora affinis]